MQDNGCEQQDSINSINNSIRSIAVNCKIERERDLSFEIRFDSYFPEITHNKRYLYINEINNLKIQVPKIFILPAPKQQAPLPPPPPPKKPGQIETKKTKTKTTNKSLRAFMILLNNNVNNFSVFTDSLQLQQIMNYQHYV